MPQAEGARGPLDDASKSMLPSGPIACLDAAYGDEAAAAACVLIEAWPADIALGTLSTTSALTAAAYAPGAFYKRELPLLLDVLDTCAVEPAAIVVDGYAWLGGEDRPGLGARLHEALARRVPVIGVAKTRFRDDTWSIEVNRGRSRRPLYVTAAGAAPSDAAAAITAMHGGGRMPAMLSLADRLARAALAAPTGRGPRAPGPGRIR